MPARSRRRRRGVALLALALACGGLAASELQRHASSIDARVGAPVPVLVARADLAPRSRIEADDVRVEEVPETFVPPDALRSPDEVVGSRAGAALPAGSYVTASALQARAQPRRPGTAPLARGERLIEVSVAGGSALPDSGGAAADVRVDVLVTSEPRQGNGRTWVALERVELVSLRAGSTAEGGESGATVNRSLALLRVSPSQAVFLTAAQAFARETRLLARPKGDRDRSRPPQVSAGDL